jgi:hypothetical protein
MLSERRSVMLLATLLVMKLEKVLKPLLDRCERASYHYQKHLSLRKNYLG